MAVEPTGLLSGPQKSLREALGKCTTWRAWTGGTEATALASTFLVHPTPAEGETFSRAELEDLRPFATIWMGPQWRFDKRGTSPCYVSAGMLIVRFEADVDPDHDERDAEIDFLNKLGAILLELSALDEGLGVLVPTSIEMPVPPQRVDEELVESEGDFIWAEVYVHFGVGER